MLSLERICKSCQSTLSGIGYFCRDCSDDFCLPCGDKIHSKNHPNHIYYLTSTHQSGGGGSEVDDDDRKKKRQRAINRYTTLMLHPSNGRGYDTDDSW